MYGVGALSFFGWSLWLMSVDMVQFIVVIVTRGRISWAFLLFV